MLLYILLFLFSLIEIQRALVLSAGIHRFPDVRQSQGSLNFWRNPQAKWPKGKIPYTISPSYTETEKSVIRSAMTEWERKTCIRFIPKTASHKDYVEITPSDGSSYYCYSYVGRVGGRQRMKMYGECIRQAAMVHELGHVIGFNHEHQRPDRDDFINVLIENVDPVYHYAFDKFSTDTVDNMGTQYDYGSVMHYPYYAFAKSNQPSMTLKDGSIDRIRTEARQLSSEDIRKVKIYYQNCN